jgi:beta-galactosidase
LRWPGRFQIDGKAVAEGAQAFALEPGAAREFTIAFETPSVTTRTKARLVLTCKRSGKEVFQDVKPLVILAPLPGLPQLDAWTHRSQVGNIAVYDPRGIVQLFLKERRYPFVHVKSLERLPAKMKVLIVGPDALTPREATDPRWVALAATGTRVLVLDQRHPLHYLAVSADVTPTDHVGRLAFPENLEHVAFSGLGPEDFLCWSGDHVVYRNVYKKASRGARSLLQCDDELSCSALCECPVKDGVLVLAQTAVGQKLASDPVARRLFDNLLRYCLDYRLPAKTTVSLFPDSDVRLKLLDDIGLRHSRRPDISAALADPKVEIIVADASPANLMKLAATAESRKRFTDRGGYLMLWGLTPEGLADYNKVVGVHHVLRPFKMERVALPGQRDPLLAGITARDVVLEGTEQIYPWAGDRYPGKDTFTHVVDLDDIAPFATAAPKYAHGWSQMTNGLTSADSWKFIFYHELKADPHPKWSAEFPHDEEVLSFSIILNTHYQVISRLRLIFDDDEAAAVTVDLKGVPELKQEFTLNPRRCKKITLEPVAFDTRGKQPTTGVDNIWIKVRRDKNYQERVVPLLNIGALVKYRMRKGGVVLNQLRILESEPNPVNGPKKQNIVSMLLRNLGATFAAERLLVAGANLKYVPIPLNDKCNQFLTADKGWIAGQPDLAQLPLGEQKFAGVDYLIRDFKTSPLPACIMLAGQGVKNTMPTAVKDIRVRRKADVLFFLHALHRTRDWKPTQDGAKKQPPTLFQYVIHYADGKSVTAPVRYDHGAGHWLSEQPHGLPEAAVAWSAPVPKDSKRQAVVYQMSWTNPRRDVEIQSVDVECAEDYGIPIILALTAGSARN